MSDVRERIRPLLALRSWWADRRATRAIREHRARQRMELAQVEKAREIAAAFHETYERLAPAFPNRNKGLMIAVVHELLEREVIR